MNVPNGGVLAGVCLMNTACRNATPIPLSSRYATTLLGNLTPEADTLV